MDGVDDDFEIEFTPSYHLEWEVGDEVVFEPEQPVTTFVGSPLYWMLMFAVFFAIAWRMRGWWGDK